MMYKILPYKAEHLSMFEIHQSQSFKHDGLTEEQRNLAYNQAESFVNFTEPRTLLYQKNPVCCLGVLEMAAWRAEAWAIMAANSGPHMKQIHNLAVGMVEEVMAKVLRLEAFVDEEFQAGHKWMRLLGFEKEGVMRRYNPDGSNVVCYSRISV